MTLQRAVFRVSADVDNDGTAEDGEFHLYGNLELTPGLRTGYLLGGQTGATANAVTGDLTDRENVNRRPYYLDLGGGARTVEARFRGWEGAEDDDDNPVQWGNTGDPTTLTKADATGADPLTQIDVLMRYLTEGEIDSRDPATLEYGEYSSGGLYSPLDVAVEGPQFTRAGDEGDWFDGTMTFVTIGDLLEPLDIRAQEPF